jgi:CO/xanthine dehydrogenase FAD-binding subunit
MYDVHYHRPASLEDALNLLAGADEPKILRAGRRFCPR